MLGLRKLCNIIYMKENIGSMKISFAVLKMASEY